MKTLGQILTFLFPQTIARLIELDHLKQDIVIKKSWLSFVADPWNKDRMSHARELAKEIQTMRRDFNSKKMWFMKKV
jgi:hypothetical protein